MVLHTRITRYFISVPILKSAIQQLKDLLRIIHRITEIIFSIASIYYHFRFNEVEYYQPLYNFQLYRTKRPQRPCVDRAELIYEELKHFGSGGRILDINCSLGYFSHYFAERGYLISGIDSNQYNISVCKKVKKINHSPIQFSVNELSFEYLERIAEGQYNVAFVLSVLHHVILDKGLSYTQTLVAKLLNKIPVLFVELARKEELVSHAWQNSLPENELLIFAKSENITIKHLGHASTYLSQVPRPIYIIQKKEICINHIKYSLLSQKFIAYQGSIGHERVFYDCAELFIKRYYIDRNKYNSAQIENEIRVYRKLPDNEFFPKLLSTSQSSNFIDLRLTKLPGKNLNDLLMNQNKVPVMKIFDQLIAGLTFLFEQGFYHNDVRVWNMHWNGAQLFLFDLGCSDIIETENTNLSLLWVIKQLLTFQFYEFKNPIDLAPDFEKQLISPEFIPIISALQEKSFDNFLKWYSVHSEYQMSIC